MVLIDRCVAARPESWRHFLFRSGLHASMGKFARAAEDLTQVLWLCPEAGVGKETALLLRAKSYNQLNMKTEAKDDLRSFTGGSTDPAHRADAYYQWAYMCCEEGDLASGKAMYAAGKKAEKEARLEEPVKTAAKLMCEALLVPGGATCGGGRQCNNCGIVKDELQRCGRCKAVAYCSRECQASAWKDHKRVCHAA